MVKRRRLELPRHNCHYPLKVARLPIPPPLQHLDAILNISAQDRTRTCTLWNTRTWNVRVYQFRHLGSKIHTLLTRYVKEWSGKRDSDPRPQPWQGCALPTELFPLVQLQEVKRRRLELPRHNCHYPLKVARLPIPPPLHYLEIPYLIQNDMLSKMFERKTGLGPATPTLARLCSTNWAISAYFLTFIGAFLWMRVQKYYIFLNPPNFSAFFL